MFHSLTLIRPLLNCLENKTRIVGLKSQNINSQMFFTMGISKRKIVGSLNLANSHYTVKIINGKKFNFEFFGKIK